MVALLDKPGYKERWHSLLEYLLPSLQRVGRHADAVEIAEKLYDPNHPIYFCTAFLLEAIEKGCDYVEALTMAKNAMKYFPKDPFFHGKELAYYFRANDQDKIQGKLQEFVDQRWPVEDRMNALLIAVVSAGRFHHMRGLELALEIRNENPQHPLHRKAYERFVIGVIESGFRAGDQAVVDDYCAVELKDEKGAVMNVVIDDKATLQHSISSSSERALLLMGKQAGAVIEMDGKLFTISKISSRYEAAFRESRSTDVINQN
ncbi:hypothetical protein WJU16_02970 [Chitinophaga pollutisoli]|uniref:Tetratricopeptide repeat protein n=1 Tax=Chitinophaga pollutisoli TaxID=3133966 RepID=A0ABZ2YRK7_9BACT